jgi:phosphate transport system protein
MRYQPMAQDLRRILASMRVASDLERIGDTAESIARRIVGIRAGAIPVERISSLASLVLDRFNRLVEAYEARSRASADDIRANDSDVDRAYFAASADILAMMETDPSFVRVGAQLLSVAKSFERVGDRLTNVAEQILFEMDGKTVFETRERPAAAV